MRPWWIQQHPTILNRSARFSWFEKSISVTLQAPVRGRCHTGRLRQGNRAVEIDRGGASVSDVPEQKRKLIARLVRTPRQLQISDGYEPRRRRGRDGRLTTAGKQQYPEKHHEM